MQDAGGRVPETEEVGVLIDADDQPAAGGDLGQRASGRLARAPGWRAGAQARERAAGVGCAVAPSGTSPVGRRIWAPLVSGTCGVVAADGRGEGSGAAQPAARTATAAAPRGGRARGRVRRLGRLTRVISGTRSVWARSPRRRRIRRDTPINHATHRELRHRAIDVRHPVEPRRRGVGRWRSATTRRGPRTGVDAVPEPDPTAIAAAAG